MYLSNPAPGQPVTSGYGTRRNPVTGRISKHHGIDYGGTFNVLAAADGTVVKVLSNLNKKIGYGYGLIVRHSATVYTVYAHGAHLPKFKKGSKVKRGEVLFRSGMSGAATGPHLHFEVRRSIVWGTDVNPAPFFVKPKPKSRTHTVRRGETLSTIAALYKTTWQKIYADNKQIIGSNPNRISVGKRLTIK
jgi:murein DD-endopeptidase MepM/ murein hydrolase activator NlpD